jgi:hypothetical protein
MVLSPEITIIISQTKGGRTNVFVLVRKSQILEFNPLSQIRKFLRYASSQILNPQLSLINSQIANPQIS